MGVASAKHTRLIDRLATLIVSFDNFRRFFFFPFIEIPLFQASLTACTKLIPEEPLSSNLLICNIISITVKMLRKALLCISFLALFHCILYPYIVQGERQNVKLTRTFMSRCRYRKHCSRKSQTLAQSGHPATAEYEQQIHSLFPESFPL